MRIVAIIVLLVALLAGALYISRTREEMPQEFSAAGQGMPQRVEFKTKDNVLIVADYYAPASSSVKGLLLLHMMPATRQSWRVFAEKMQRVGYHVLAVDLRGHGESQGGPNGYRNFSDAEHQASRGDAEAGAEYLQSRGVTELYIGGASIGANLALQYLAEHPGAKAAFLLSPGSDYRGVKTEPAVWNLTPGHAVYYVASRDDGYSADTIQKLFDTTPTGMKKEIKFFDAAGHGTTIFEREPAFMDTIASWLQKVANP